VSERAEDYAKERNDMQKRLMNAAFVRAMCMKQRIRRVKRAVICYSLLGWTLMPIRLRLDGIFAIA
jgi:hypothetical protein